MRLRIDLAYDGQPFWGFARQTDQITVQGVLEDALRRVLNRDTVETTCAGRTDRGVHAEIQTVHLDVPADWRRLRDLSTLQHTLDRMVGEAITIWRVRRVPRSFNARFSATGRRYRYRLCDGATMPPLWRHDTHHVGRPLDVEAMEAAAQPLVGTHDYSSFCRRRIVQLGDGRKVDGTMMRRIDLLTVRRSRPADLVLVRVHGKAFCHQMVRAITGSLLEVGLGRKDVDWVGELLEAKDRTHAGPVAPARGLSLVGITY